jgi:hypothetical protein
MFMKRLCLLTFLIPGLGYGQATTITTFDVPGASATIPAGINGNGDIVGTYSLTGSPPQVFGFIRSPAGAFTTFDPPPGSVSMRPLSINNSGDVVGSYEVRCLLGEDRQCEKGFAMVAGTFINLDGLATSQCPNPIPVSINNNGEFTGICRTGNKEGLFPPSTKGFVANATGLTTFDLGGLKGFGTEGILSINNLGDVAGSGFVKLTGITTGFVRSSTGTITSFSVESALAWDTTATAINDAGEITGFYRAGNRNNPTEGAFVRSATGLITTFAPSGGSDPTPVSINGGGYIAGNFISAGSPPPSPPYPYQGFVRAPNGTFDLFVGPPGSEYYGGLSTVGMNDTNVVTGFYGDSTGTHGFVSQW